MKYCSSREDCIAFCKDDAECQKEQGFIPKLSRSTGVPTSTLSVIYDVQDIREKLKVFIDEDFAKKPSQQIIVRTVGLPHEERVKLIVKALDMGWSGLTVLEVDY